MSDDLPMGWVWTNFVEIAENTPNALKAGPFGSALKKSFYVPSGYKIYGQEQVIKEDPFYGDYYIDEEKYNSLRSCSVKPKDILISLVGTIGKVLILPEGISEGIINPRLVKLSLHKSLTLAEFIKAYLESPSVRDYFSKLSHGGTMDILNLTTLKALPILLPPLNEQRRIVDKLERIGDRHRTARNELNHIPKLIARYKQAVLAAACSGKLTEDFRLLHSLSISTISLSEACNSITDGDHQAPPKSETGIPFITISAINDGALSLNKATRFVPKSYFDSLSKIRKPEIGDILFTVTGSIGIPVIVDTDEPFVFQRHIAILKANENLILSKYLLYTLGSEQIQKQALNVATGTAQLTIPLGGLRNFQIQLPSLEEQKEIVRRVEKMFEKIDRMEQEYQKAAKLCDRLEQATLAKAFRGELVPQDPDDEPASVLLEQVKSQRSKGKKGK
jgi:type I restriction enzyme S subunit